MAREIALQDRAQKHLRDMRARGEPVWWFKVHGNKFQRRGVGDLIICYHGRFLHVELKQSEKEQPEPAQIHQRNEVRRAGGVAEVVGSMEQFIHLLTGVEMLSPDQREEIVRASLT